MADRPIIFSGPMVRAILDGRKTQTRRLLTPQPPKEEAFFGSSFGMCPAVADGVKLYSQNDYERLPKHPTKWELVGSVGVARDAGFPKVYDARFAVGDRLWVRETIACGACAPSRPSHWSPSFWRREQGTPENPSGLWYAADGLAPQNPFTDRGRWVPSIQTPRWASRLTLTVTDVRVQRLQEISDEDADAEVFGGDFPHSVLPELFPDADASGERTLRECFAILWDSLNARRAPWESNPWVCAISFSAEKANIDATSREAA